MDKVVEQLMKERLPIHPKCRGEGFDPEEAKNIVSERCSRVEILSDLIPEDTEVEDNIDFCRCTTYFRPEYWWSGGRRCPLADHYRIQTKAQQEKTRVGQQKQKKKK